MVTTIHIKDRYNFNVGSSDIVSKTPDAVNGRFAELGWAKTFFTIGQSVREVTWTEREIRDSTNIVNNNGR